MLHHSQALLFRYLTVSLPPFGRKMELMFLLVHFSPRRYMWLLTCSTVQRQVSTFHSRPFFVTRARVRCFGVVSFLGEQHYFETVTSSLLLAMIQQSMCFFLLLVRTSVLEARRLGLVLANGERG